MLASHSASGEVDTGRTSLGCHQPYLSTHDPHWCAWGSNPWHGSTWFADVGPIVCIE